MSTLGERLRRAREKKGLSQTEVSRRTNINNKTLSRYENDGSEPDLDTLKTLATLYGVTVDYLTGYSVKETNEGYTTNSKEEQIRKEKLKLADMIINLPDNERKLIEDMIKTLQSKHE